MWTLVATTLLLARPYEWKWVAAHEEPLHIAAGAEEVAALPNHDVDAISYATFEFMLRPSLQKMQATDDAIHRIASLSCLAHGFWAAVVCGAVCAAWRTRRRTSASFDSRRPTRVDDASSVTPPCLVRA
jgi:hypothetical protein